MLSTMASRKRRCRQCGKTNVSFHSLTCSNNEEYQFQYQDCGVTYWCTSEKPEATSYFLSHSYSNVGKSSLGGVPR